MAHHHDDHGHGHNEQKPVSFTVPLIFGAITVFIILLFVSLGDPGHCECAEVCSQECKEACAKGDHSKHPEGMSMEDCHGKEAGHGEHHEANHDEHAAEPTAVADSAATTPADTTHHVAPAAEPAKEEAHH